MFDDTQELLQAETVEAVEAPVQAATNIDSDKEKNMRFLREAKERAERERDEALRFARDLESRSAQKAPEEDEVSLNDNDLVEWQHVKKKFAKMETELKNYRQYSTESVMEHQLRRNYPDFDQIVSKENVEALRRDYPELAQTLHSSTDTYNKAASAYTLIKKLGINAVDPYAANKELAQRNAAKPRPLTSVSPQQGDTPLSHANAFANGLTEDLKKQLHQEMMQAMKGN